MKHEGRMKRFLSVCLLAAALAGCAASGVKVTDSHLAAFKEGETTEAQVIAALGQPTTRMRMPDGTVIIVYAYSAYSVRPQTFIPIVGGFVGGADGQASSVSLTFGPDGKLLNTASSASTFGTGQNAASGVSAPIQTQQPRQP